MKQCVELSGLIVKREAVCTLSHLPVYVGCNAHTKAEAHATTLVSKGQGHTPECEKSRKEKGGLQGPW